jgi:hypothetical protein
MPDELSIAYQGAFYDYSGYGEANRQVLASFDAAGVRVNGSLLRYTKSDTDYGHLNAIIQQAIDNNDDYDIHIMHVTPDEIPRIINLEKYSIAHFFWETNKVPQRFIDGLNLVNEM